MTDLKIFKNDQFGEIRTVEENGTVLFCGSDIAPTLTRTTARQNIHTRNAAGKADIRCGLRAG